MGVFGSDDSAPLTRDDFYDNASWRRWQQCAGECEQQVDEEMAAEAAEKERSFADLAKCDGPLPSDGTARSHN